MVMLAGVGVAAAGCSSPTVSTPTGRVTPMPSRSASGGPCASLKVTTPIQNVPAACADLWAPYQVTVVPPPGILQQEHVPAAPKVVNMTAGAVSDADAQHWADASNSQSGWLQWAEANDQPGFLIHVAGPDVINVMEQHALSQGATIAQPSCNLFPVDNKLYPVGSNGNAYFSRKGLPTDNQYVLVATFKGPCSATATFPDGKTTSIQESAQTAVVFIPGTLRHEPNLGDIWYSDGGGSCNDPDGPPGDWCGR
jgi:hypothetical protein